MTLENWGGAKKVLLDFCYPIGSYFITDSSNFDTTAKVIAHFGGTWEQITADAYLKAVTSNAGITGGSNTIAVANLPAHNHSYNLSTNSTGGHTHTRGSMTISGSFGYANTGDTNVSFANGVFSRSYLKALDGGIGGGKYFTNGWGNTEISFNAANNWNGETSNNGSHSHSITGSISNTGSGQAFHPLYQGVYIYRRKS